MEDSVIFWVVLPALALLPLTEGQTGKEWSKTLMYLAILQKNIPKGCAHLCFHFYTVEKSRFELLLLYRFFKF